ncbi:hypothetical protein [Afifella pfennigii]|uniref:hypothetical protein n=1 Tax=Afifella pfennigii TaxID=209897 RepID=UPI0006911B85|nr:hypothetical protein [Afifella pfennigii]
MMALRFSLAGALLGAAFLARGVLEADPLTHILVQLPMLAVAGALLPVPAGWERARCNAGGWAALLTAIFTIAYWMLPRTIDATLVVPWVEAAKFIALPLGVGFALRLGWARAHPLLRGFLKAQALAMLGVLAFLYTHAPVRLCTAYLMEEQARLGLGFLIVAGGLAVLWVAPLFAVCAPAPRADRAGGRVPAFDP